MFTTYAASAGSGKTTSLVASYLSLCFTNPDKYRNILAITFTNNATAEMKKRIIETLTSFAFQSPENFNAASKAIYEQIIATLALHNPTSLTALSQALLSKILYDYNNFSISTIDSFFQRLIRSFAFDLGLNINFNVQIELDELYAQTVDTLISKISEDHKELSNRVIAMINQKLEKVGRWSIEQDLKNIINSSYQEEAYIPLKALTKMQREEFYCFCEEVRKKYIAIKEELLQLADQGKEIIQKTGLEASDFVGISKGIYSYFDKLKKEVTSRQGVFQKDGSFTKKTPLDSSVHTALCALLSQIQEQQSLYWEYHFFAQNIGSLQLLFDLREIMDDIKLRDNLFYLSEANTKVYDEIKDQDTPYLYEKLGNKYFYFLIDEFQDTSQMQWKNIKPLILNTLSSQNSYHESGECALFGDVKQAIYRFRNGDASLLQTLSSTNGFLEEFNFDKNYLDYYQLVSLDTNWRSTRAIIQFNNDFFSFLRDQNIIPEKTKNYYLHNEQKIPATSKEEGFVKIEFMTDKRQKEHENLDEFLVLQAVKDALSHGFCFQDIAVLVRGNQVGARLGKMLSKEHFPVISPESLQLSSSQEVMLLVATLQYIYDHNHSLAKLFIFNYIKNHSEYENSIDPIEIISQDQLFTDFLSSCNIVINSEKLKPLPLFTIVKELIRCYDLWLSEANLFVSSFLDTLLLYKETFTNEISTFLIWWDKIGSQHSIIAPSGINAITISTIHKSKGLQYPIVIMLFSDFVGISQNSKAWIANPNEGIPYFHVSLTKDTPEKWQTLYEESQALNYTDGINLAYVAQTRAAKGLYIITGDPYKRDRDGNPTEINPKYPGYLNQFLQSSTHTELYPASDTVCLGNPDFLNSKPIQNTDLQAIKQIHHAPFTFSHNDMAWDIHEKSEEQMTGLIVHDYLSHLKDFPATEADIERLIIEEDERYHEPIRHALRTIMNDITLKPYFSAQAKVMNECTIVTQEGEMYRPDRIIFIDHDVMVLDYKTGKPKDIYQKQLDKYIHLLKEMGYKNVHGKLLYLSS